MCIFSASRRVFLASSSLCPSCFANQPFSELSSFPGCFPFLLFWALHPPTHPSHHPPPPLPACSCLYLRRPSPAACALRLTQWHFTGNLISLLLVFPWIPFDFCLFLPPDTRQTEAVQPRAANTASVSLYIWSSSSGDSSPASFSVCFSESCFQKSFGSGTNAPFNERGF